MQRQKSMAACSCVLVGDFSKAAPRIDRGNAARVQSCNFGQSRAVSILSNLQFVLSRFLHDTLCAMAYNNYPRVCSCSNMSCSDHLLTILSSGIVVWQAAVWLSTQHGSSASYGYASTQYQLYMSFHSLIFPRCCARHVSSSRHGLCRKPPSRPSCLSCCSLRSAAKPTRHQLQRSRHSSWCQSDRFQAFSLWLRLARLRQRSWQSYSTRSRLRSKNAARNCSTRSSHPGRG
jgi:hypothetical protein